MQKFRYPAILLYLPWLAATSPGNFFIFPATTHTVKLIDRRTVIDLKHKTGQVAGFAICSLSVGEIFLATNFHWQITASTLFTVFDFFTKKLSESSIRLSAIFIAYSFC
jgi:hypothetical protein